MMRACARNLFSQGAGPSRLLSYSSPQISPLTLTRQTRRISWTSTFGSRARIRNCFRFCQNCRIQLCSNSFLKDKVFLGNLLPRIKLRSFSFVTLTRRHLSNLRYYFGAVPVLIYCHSYFKSSTVRLCLCARCEASVPVLPSLEIVVPPVVAGKQQNHRVTTFWQSLSELILLNVRAIYLFCVFFPLLLTYPLTYVGPRSFTLWLNLLYVAVERSGATFVKLGQWASTRRDLFSKEVCDLFSGLHHRVRPHPWPYTVKALKRAYGKKWQTLLHLVDNQEPIGSGCIAQVYKGYVSTDFVPNAILKDMEEDKSKVYFGEGIEISRLTVDEDDETAANEDMSDVVVTGMDVIPVAIKVLHPDIRATFHRDLKLMRMAAHCLTTVFPRLHWVNLNQCVEEFAVTMKKQLDMRHEYQCLKRFTRDFESFANVRVPQPIPKFVRKNILVETFEEGVSIGQIVRDAEQPVELKEELAKIGMDVLMQMVFVNNFVHADLHPGNLLVQNIEHFNVQKTALVQVDALDMMVVDIRPMEENPLKLVLLDCGITASLGPEDKIKFREVFTAVVKGEGEAVADLFLSKSAVNHCSNPELFRKDMAEIVARGRQNLMSISKMKVAELMNDVFNVLAHHKIQLQSSFATIILAIAMLEGLGRSLDPNLDLLDKARPVLLGSVF